MPREVRVAFNASCCEVAIRDAEYSDDSNEKTCATLTWFARLSHVVGIRASGEVFPFEKWTAWWTRVGRKSKHDTLVGNDRWSLRSASRESIQYIASPE